MKASPRFLPVLLPTFFHSLRKRVQGFPLPCFLPSGSLASLFSSSLSPSCLPLCCQVNPGCNFHPHTAAPILWLLADASWAVFHPQPHERQKHPQSSQKHTAQPKQKTTLEGEEKDFLTVPNFARVYKCQHKFWNSYLFGPIYHIRQRLPSQVVTYRQ